MPDAVLSEITIYPIKSLGGCTAESALIEKRGLQFDRRWLLIDKNNQFLTQREFPKMALISIKIEAENLCVQAKNFDDLLLGFEPASKERIKVQIWADVCDAVVCGENINGWFSRVLNTDCRLVFMPDDARRPIEREYAVDENDITSFSDAFPLLLIGEKSLGELNSRLAKPVLMNRFRPNFTIRNIEAFAEDNWGKIRIGDSIFHLVKPCARCIVTTINQETGASDGKSPLQTLAQFRTVNFNGKNKVVFGQYLIAENPGATVRVCDQIEVLK